MEIKVQDYERKRVYVLRQPANMEYRLNKGNKEKNSNGKGSNLWNTKKSVTSTN